MDDASLQARAAGPHGAAASAVASAPASAATSARAGWWRPRIGIRELLLAVNAFALLVPLASILLLRIFDDQLIRRTEAQLIGQSVLIAEAWREAWLR